MSAKSKEKTSSTGVYRRVRFAGICAFAREYGYHYTSVYKHLTGQRPSKTIASRWRIWQAVKQA